MNIKTGKPVKLAFVVALALFAGAFIYAAKSFSAAFRNQLTAAPSLTIFPTQKRASSWLGVASALVHRFRAGATQRFNSRFKPSMEESLP